MFPGHPTAMHLAAFAATGETSAVVTVSSAARDDRDCSESWSQMLRAPPPSSPERPQPAASGCAANGMADRGGAVAAEALRRLVAVAHREAGERNAGMEVMRLISM